MMFSGWALIRAVCRAYSAYGFTLPGGERRALSGTALHLISPARALALGWVHLKFPDFGRFC